MISMNQAGALITIALILITNGCAGYSRNEISEDPAKSFYSGSIPSDVKSLCEIDFLGEEARNGFRVIGEYRADGRHFSFFSDPCGSGMDVFGFTDSAQVLVFRKDREEFCNERGRGSSYICVVNVEMDATVRLVEDSRGEEFLQIEDIHKYTIR